MSRYTAWIGTNSVRNSLGIYTISIDTDTMDFHVTSTQKAYNTGALALSKDGRRLYAASEGMSFMGRASGGAMAYLAGDDGTLTQINEIPTGGQRPCTLALRDGEELYAANFFGGSISMMRLREDGGIAGLRRMIEEPMPQLDHWMHAMHAVAVGNHGQLAAMNVSQSEAVVYDAQTGERLASYSFGDYAFPRSIAVRGDFIYAMMQDPADLYVFRNRAAEEGRLELIQKCPVYPEWEGFAGSSALRISADGAFLMGAVRRANSISVHRIGADGTLSYCGTAIVPGETPRDFHLSPDGKIVVAAMQFSDEVRVLSFDSQTAALTPIGESVKVPSPAAVVIRKEEEA